MESPLVRAYSGMMSVLTFPCILGFPSIYTKLVLGHRADIIGSPSDGQVFLQGLSKYIPSWVLLFLGDTIKSPRFMRIREVRAMAISVADQMVRDKSEMLLRGKGGRDVFSLLGVCPTPSGSLKSDESNSQGQYGRRCGGEDNERGTVGTDAVGSQDVSLMIADNYNYAELSSSQDMRQCRTLFVGHCSN